MQKSFLPLAKCTCRSADLIVIVIDAQSFSNSFEGVHVVVKKSGRGPLFSCFIAFLCHNFSKSFEGVHEVPPSSPLSPLCASMVIVQE
jgi:hypothetical protein